MRIGRLDDMTKGWFVGDFTPTLYRSRDVEVAVKRYSAGDNEGCHVHRVATEITVIVSGEVTMNGRILKGGDIVVLEPGESTDFVALTDAVTTVVKLPCVAGDKFEEV
jgi:mannose-6-phosphate isomerase-like protein (cupin superfamily)